MIISGEYSLPDFVILVDLLELRPMLPSGYWVIMPIKRSNSRTGFMATFLVEDCN